MIYTNRNWEEYSLKPIGMHNINGKTQQLMLCEKHSRCYPAIYTMTDKGKIIAYGLKCDVKKLRNNYFPNITNAKLEELYKEFCAKATIIPPKKSLDLMKEILTRECKKLMSQKRNIHINK